MKKEGLPVTWEEFGGWACPDLTPFNQMIYEFYLYSKTEFVMQCNAFSLVRDIIGLPDMTRNEARYFLSTLIEFYHRLSPKKTVTQEGIEL